MSKVRPPRRKKITHIQFSGIGGHLREFAAFAKHGGENFLQTAIFYGNLPVCPELRSYCTYSQIPYTYIPRRRGWLVWEFLKIVSALVRFRPDIVVVRGCETVPIAFGYSVFFDSIVVTIETQSSLLKSAKQRVLSKLAMLLSDQIVVLTSQYAKELAQACGRFFCSDKVHVIPNGIDMDLFRSRASEPRTPMSQIFHVGMQSRVVSVKEHDVLLRAIEWLPSCLSDGRQLVLSVAGDGELLSEVKELAVRLKIDTRVIFHGELIGEQLVNFMDSLDLYVHATKGESFCFSVFEALALERMVVTADVPVLSGLLHGQAFVEFYRQGDHESLACAIERAASVSVSESKLLGRNARAFVKRGFSSEQMITRYRRLFSDAVRDHEV